MNPLKSGAELIVNARGTASFPEFEKMGARATTDLKEVARADIIFLSLPNGETLRDVLLGEKGIGHQLQPGQIVVDTSTITYAATLEIATSLEARGIAFLDLHPRFAADWAAHHRRFDFDADGHWNELGHSVAAAAIAGQIGQAH